MAEIVYRLSGNSVRVLHSRPSSWERIELPNVYDIMATEIADCESCGAVQGSLCINNSGRLSQSTHWKRKWTLQLWKRNNPEQYREKMRKLKEKSMSPMSQLEIGLLEERNRLLERSVNLQQESMDF